jgi:hypothetical protein
MNTDILEYRPLLGPLFEHLFVNGEMHRPFLHRQREMKRLRENGPEG